jgi:hypothetical protein
MQQFTVGICGITSVVNFYVEYTFWVNDLTHNVSLLGLHMFMPFKFYENPKRMLLVGTNMHLMHNGSDGGG